MPEVSAEDLRRLRSLQNQLRSIESRANAAEALGKELRAALAGKTKEFANAQRLVDRLVAENRLQAEQLAAAVSAREAALNAAEEKVRGEADNTRRMREAEAAAKRWQQEAERLRDELAQMRAQIPADRATAPVLTGASIARLIDEFAKGIEQRTSGVRLHESKVTLHVGLAGTEAGPVFVVPRAGADAGEIGPLHEFVMSFERDVRADEPDPALEA